MNARDHELFGRLSGHAPAIRGRMLVDREFRDLARDYCDALAALRRWKASTDPRERGRTDEFADLVTELERDIRHELKLD